MSDRCWLKMHILWSETFSCIHQVLRFHSLWADFAVWPKHFKPWCDRVLVRISTRQQSQRSFMEMQSSEYKPNLNCLLGRLNSTQSTFHLPSGGQLKLLNPFRIHQAFKIHCLAGRKKSPPRFNSFSTLTVWRELKLLGLNSCVVRLIEK